MQQINGVFGALPMIGEHYALQWKPPAQTLATEETETLMGAFRREIEAVRLRQQESPDTNFLEALEQVFDYREWFHFDVWVTPIGGQRQRLTDRIAGTRSGAEQFFAAPGALYRSAAHNLAIQADGIPARENELQLLNTLPDAGTDNAGTGQMGISRRTSSASLS